MAAQGWRSEQAAMSPIETPMLTVEEALERVLAAFQPLEPERCAAAGGAGARAGRGRPGPGRLTRLSLTPLWMATPCAPLDTSGSTPRRAPAGLRVPEANLPAATWARAAVAPGTPSVL